MAGTRVTGSVLLSASVPDPGRDPAFFGTADLIAIRDAVRGLATVVLPRTTLVFGGHPAVTPLVRQVAEALGCTDRVVVYQSRLFATIAPADNRSFSDVRWIDAVANDRAASLNKMREAMVRDSAPDVAVFIGGMEGVIEEAHLVRRMSPRTTLLPVGSTGGAARVLLDDMRAGMAPQIADALAHRRTYSAIFDRLIFP